MVTPYWIRPRPPRLCGRCGLVAVLSVWVPAHTARAQTPAKYDTSLYRGLVWREVGPFRGGRVTAFAGSSAQPLNAPASRPTRRRYRLMSYFAGVCARAV